MSVDSLTSSNQNLVIAVNNLTKTKQYLAGQYTSDTYSGAATVVIATTRGQLINLCLTQAGGTVDIYNQSSSATLLPSKLLYSLPATATVGIYPIGQVFSSGLVIVLGAGASANVTYSLG